MAGDRLGGRGLMEITLGMEMGLWRKMEFWVR